MDNSLILAIIGSVTSLLVAVAMASDWRVDGIDDGWCFGRSYDLV